MCDTPPIAVARIATEHFEFQAIARTPADARAALLAMWQRHADDTGADPDYVTADDINAVEGTYGSTFRDGSPYPCAAPDQTWLAVADALEARADALPQTVRNRPRRQTLYNAAAIVRQQAEADTA